MLNERGFIYPLSLCIYLLFIQFLLLLYDVYQNKKAIEVEATHSIIQEYYFLSVIKEVENQLAHNEIASSKGIYSFINGEVHYTINSSSTQEYKIDYKLYHFNKKAVSGTSYFNKEQNRMVKWVEIN
ncbi:competence type IV pilus minor pilin ComGG [Bacillus sp. B1-b2]|uniref:competence type IV pilus minor pilin ComGG n=1 Tax=Bacillus sp. B1-b2 TaxID=2653201 RepID=UPI001869FBB4|nr:competence type IV pilus minor pilin ComGG [Bacillus sp. B1-b2]